MCFTIVSGWRHTHCSSRRMLSPMSNYRYSIIDFTLVSYQDLATYEELSPTSLTLFMRCHYHMHVVSSHACSVVITCVLLSYACSVVITCVVLSHACSVVITCVVLSHACSVVITCVVLSHACSVVITCVVSHACSVVITCVVSHACSVVITCVVLSHACSVVITCVVSHACSVVTSACNVTTGVQCRTEDGRVFAAGSSFPAPDGYNTWLEQSRVPDHAYISLPLPLPLPSSNCLDDGSIVCTEIGAST